MTLLSFVFALATPEILTLVSVLLGGGFFAAIIGVYKARPERDSVIVSSAQNAATILQGLNAALYEELNRERQRCGRTVRNLDYTERLLRTHEIDYQLPEPD